jgi:hypothetical protein
VLTPTRHRPIIMMVIIVVITLVTANRGKNQAFGIHGVLRMGRQVLISLRLVVETIPEHGAVQIVTFI